MVRKAVSRILDMAETSSPSPERGSRRATPRRAAESAPSTRQDERDPRPDDLLSVRDASIRLGIQPATLYDWLGRSDRGLLVIRGRPVTIQYYQGGAAGQGRIRIELGEVHRLRELMRVQTQPLPQRRPPAIQARYPGIIVPLGRPLHP